MMKRTLTINSFQPGINSIPNRNLDIMIKLKSTDPHVENILPAEKFSRNMEFRKDQKSTSFEYEITGRTLITVEVYAIETGKKIIITEEPVLIGTGTIDMSLKSDNTPIAIKATRRIKPPAPYVRQSSSISSWRRPADYVPPTSRRKSRAENREDDFTAEAEKAKAKNEKLKKEKLENSLDHMYSGFSAKLYITIVTDKSSMKKESKSQNERTKRILFKGRDESEYQEAVERANKSAEEKYESFIKSEFKFFIQNKKVVDEIQKENEEKEQTNEENKEVNEEEEDKNQENETKEEENKEVNEENKTDNEEETLKEEPKEEEVPEKETKNEEEETLDIDDLNLSETEEEE